MKFLLLIFTVLLLQVYGNGQVSSSDTSTNLQNQKQFQVDSSITGFKLASISENGFIYTPNGTKDLHNGNESSGFNILPIDKIPFEKGIELSEYMASSFNEKGIVSNLKRGETIINGKRLYEMSFDVKVDGKIQHVYQAFILKGNSAIAFMGTDIDGTNLVSKFKKTARAIIF